MVSQDFQLPAPFFSNAFHPNILSIILVFFALLLLVFLSCYFHSWFCYRHFTTSLNNNNNIAITSSLHTQAQSVGLDSDIISSLPVVLHSFGGLNANGVKETECSICLGIFEDEDMIKVLPKCSHGYHSECVDRWLTNRSSCPLCRDSLLP